MGRTILSICAVVVATGLAGAAQPVQPQQQPPTTNQSAKAAEPARQQRAPIFVTLSKPDRQGEANQKQSDDNGARSEPSPWYDLWAQSLMALWALCQLVLTGIGIWYVRKTLVATEKAVEEAGEATSAAKSVISVTRDGQKTELRAYVSVTKVTMSVSPAGICATAVYTNAGQTPAKNLVARLWVRVGQGAGVRRADVIEDPVNEEEASRSLLARDEEKAISHTAELINNLDPQMIWDGDFTVIAFGRITYEDVFGDSHETKFCSFRDARTRPMATPVVAASFGNTAT